MKYKFIFLFILAGLFVVVPNVYSDIEQKLMGNKENYQAVWDQKIKDIHDQLGLSAEQQKELEKNREEYQKQKDNLYQNIRKTKEDLNLELQKIDIDMNVMQKLHDRIKELKAQKEDLRFESILEVKKILSAEQFQEFMKLKEEMKFQLKRKKI